MTTNSLHVGLFVHVLLYLNKKSRFIYAVFVQCKYILNWILFAVWIDKMF